jgi:hypothetical protein
MSTIVGGSAVTETLMPLFAHCPESTCPGNQQQPVEGVCAVKAETIGNRGGGGAGGEALIGLVEKTTEYLRFADPADVECPEDGCSRVRELSRQERPNYGSAYGGSEALLRARRVGGGDASRDSVLAAARDAQMRPATAREQLDEAYVLGRIEEGEYSHKRAVLEGSTVKQKPGPKPRAEED